VRPSSESPPATILLVECDEAVRRYLSWSLHLEGFRVLAKDGEHAHRLSDRLAAPIELLVIGALDHGDDSDELRKGLETHRPSLRTIVLGAISEPEAPATTLDPVRSPATPSINAEAIIGAVRALLGTKND